MKGWWGGGGRRNLGKPMDLYIRAAVLFVFRQVGLSIIGPS